MPRLHPSAITFDAVGALSQEMPPKKHFGSELFEQERESESDDGDVLNVEQLSER